MDTISKLKENYAKLESICKEHEVEILENSMEEFESYITFKYIKNKELFNKLFLLREKEYVFHFEKREVLFTLTISGKQKLYEDILEVFEQKEKVFHDIDELISFTNKVEEKELSIVSYFNGITYFYEISKNKYGNALEYYNFFYDGYRYHYQTNNYESFYEILKNINKDIEVYKNLMKDTDIVLEEKITSKNVNIQDIREIYFQKGSKELFIIFKNKTYYIVIKLNNNIYLYQYDNELSIKNIIPDLFGIYLEDSKGNYKEDRHSCLGKSFYMNVINSDNKLFIYNIDDEDLDYYIQYLNLLTKEIIKDKEYNQNIVNTKINLENKSYGFADVLLLSVGVLIFSIFVFLITLSFLK